MPTPEEMAATMRANVEEKTGHPISHWMEVLGRTKLEKHGEMVKHLKAQGVGHGFANLLVHDFRDRKSGGAAGTGGGAVAEGGGGLVDAQYSGKKADLRPIHDAVVAAASGLGDDVEVSPKKTYVSLRRKKQFAQVGPATNTQVEVGLNFKGHATTDRLVAAGGMCTHRVRLADVTEVDDELRGWMREAYEGAG